MNVNENEIYPLLEQALTTVQRGSAVTHEFSPELRLTGADGALDSLDTMLFLDEAEELLRSKYGVKIKLVSDEAFSRDNSPYASMSALAGYIRELLSESAI